MEEVVSEEKVADSSEAGAECVDLPHPSNCPGSHSDRVIEHPHIRFSETPSLEDIRGQLEQFTKERNWDQFHAPRNLLLAMVGEVGELAELFQWRDHVAVGLPNWTAREREKVSHELSDVFLYLVMLSDACGIDLPTAAKEKIAHNISKYPVNEFYGDSRKYNEVKKVDGDQKTT